MVPWRIRRGHRRAWILLAVVAAGILAAGFDLFDDHAVQPRASAPSHSENGGPASHLVRHQAAKSSPCSVCYFSKLLGQGLFPSSASVSLADVSMRAAAPTSMIAAGTDLGADVNRGPPSQLSDLA